MNPAITWPRDHSAKNKSRKGNKMRIAISGAHSQGKSTLVRDRVNRHPHYAREKEPYRVLHHEGYKIRFRDQCSKLDNGIQMYYIIGQVNAYQKHTDCVIFDRCPVDYIAYSQYTADCKTSDINDAYVKAMVPHARESLQHLDLLVFLPITNAWPVKMEDDGIRPIDLPYRDDDDAILKQIYREQRVGVMNDSIAPVFIELWCAREERLDKLEQAIKKPMA